MVLGRQILSSALSFNTVDPMSKILGFSERLERDLSDDVFQSIIW